MRETLRCPGSLWFNRSLPFRSGSYKSSACETITQFISSWAYQVLSFQTSTRLFFCWPACLRPRWVQGYLLRSSPEFHLCRYFKGGKPWVYFTSGVFCLFIVFEDPPVRTLHRTLSNLCTANTGLLQALHINYRVLIENGFSCPHYTFLLEWCCGK